MKQSRNVGRQRGICLYMLPLPLFNRHLETNKAEKFMFGWWTRFSVMGLGYSIIIGYGPDVLTSTQIRWLNHRIAPWKRPQQGWRRPRTSTKLHVAWTTRHHNAPQHVMLVVRSYRWNCRYIPRYIFPPTLPQLHFIASLLPFFFLWQSSGSGLVTAYADGNALRELSQSLKYHTWLRSDVEAWVALKTVEPTTSSITRFYRVRVIRVCTDTKRLSCSCGFFSRHGFPCRHLYAVLKVCRGVNSFCV